MNEVEKMYRNADVKPIHYDACKIEDAYWLNEELANEYGTFDNYMKLNCPYKYQECTDECKHAFDRDTYPPFTAEKQLLLIQWLTKTRPIHINLLLDKWTIEGMVRYGKRYDTFEDALSGYINEIWQDLTEEERKQIKNILE